MEKEPSHLAPVIKVPQTRVQVLHHHNDILYNCVSQRADRGQKGMVAVHSRVEDFVCHGFWIGGHDRLGQVVKMMW